MTTSLLSSARSFEALGQCASRLQKAPSIVEMFHADPDRGEDFVIRGAGLELDFSKALLDRTTLGMLLQLADEYRWQEKARGLLDGDPVNNTEGRPALHTLLRASSAGTLGEKFSEVSETRERMKFWADDLNAGRVTGFSGDVITDVVNIGIGGSDLGPRLVSEALTPYHESISCHYVANIDPSDLQETLLGLDPASTLFIICSKSFRTEETLTNGLAARQWLLNAGATTEDLDKHFLAITTNLEAAAEFGLSTSNCLPLWDWVGGRYSVWSAIGLSTAIAIGWDNFDQFLSGAREMDAHFIRADGNQNLPLILSLLEVWYSNFLGADNYVILPYSQHLQRLPDFLQQLTMESNGKRVSSNGEPLPYGTGPVLWGAAGTMGQHSFHQLLHQGTRLCPADFILPLTTHTGMASQHRQLVANCLAQSRTMLIGRTVEEARAALLSRGETAAEAERLAPHLAMPGNRPNNVITMDSLTPASLGALLALYEHRTFCSGLFWGINSFDQWGVELGKEIGVQILAQLATDAPAGEGAPLDPSTSRLMNSWRNAQGD